VASHALLGGRLLRTDGLRWERLGKEAAARTDERKQRDCVPMIGLARKLVLALKQAPGILAWRRRRWNRYFESRTYGSYFKDVYPTYAAALAAIPADKARGYDGPGPAAFYRERTQQVYATDYPVLFWLRPLLRPGLKIFDLGGHALARQNVVRSRP
jgi:hypothetical protein